MAASELSDVQIRAHALDLAVGLHRDTLRLFVKDVPEPDLAGTVLADARRFAAWIQDGGEEIGLVAGDLVRVSESDLRSVAVASSGGLNVKNVDFEEVEGG